METYDVDGDFDAAFPDGIAPHPLLAPFFGWLEEQPWGSVGYFYATPGSGDDLVPAEVSVDEDFAFVLRLPDGGLAGFWLAEIRDIEKAPFAVFSSEGELNLVAPNFPCFVDRLARQDWSVYGASANFLVEEDDEDEDDDFEEDQNDDPTPNRTLELKAWIDAQPGLRAFVSSTQMSPEEIDKSLDGGRPQRWIDTKVDDGERALEADPVRATIARTLREGGVKDGAFRVFAAGDQMIIRRGMAIIEGPSNRLKKIDKSLEAALQPHLFAARQALAAAKPGFGLWTSATLMVTEEGRVDISPSPDHEITIGNDVFPARAYAEDQARYPRKPNLIAPWLRELIDRSDDQ